MEKERRGGERDRDIERDREGRERKREGERELESNSDYSGDERNRKPPGEVRLQHWIMSAERSRGTTGPWEESPEGGEARRDAAPIGFLGKP